MYETEPIAKGMDSEKGQEDYRVLRFADGGGLGGDDRIRTDGEANQVPQDSRESGTDTITEGSIEVSKPSDILRKTGLGGHSAGSMKAKPGQGDAENPFAAKPATTDGAPVKSASPKSQRGGGGAHAPSPAASKVTNIRPKV